MISLLPILKGIIPTRFVVFSIILSSTNTQKIHDAFFGGHFLTQHRSKAFEPLTQTANKSTETTGLIIARENKGKSSCIADANSPELVGEDLFNRLN